MTLIAILLLLGVFLFVVEIFLLPGISIAGLGALAAFGYAVYHAFAEFGNAAGFITLGTVLVLIIIALVFFLRAKTWKRFTLKTNIDSTSQELPQDQQINVGDRGTAVTRLAPMGKIIVNGKTVEAKSIDVYIDERSEVEVVSFDNFSVVVKPVK